MKLASRSLTQPLHAEIAEAIAALERVTRRAKRDEAGALKLRGQLDLLEDQHNALAGRKTFSRSEAGDMNAIMLQRGKLATAIEEAEAAAEDDRVALANVLRAVQPLGGRLMTSASEQIRADAAAVLKPFFVSEGLLAQAAATTELEQACRAHMMRGFQGLPMTLPEGVSMAESALAVLRAIAAAEDIYSFPTAQPEAKAA